MTFNDGEYGQVIRVDLGLDVSGATDLTVELQPQRGDTKTFTSNVVVGTSKTDVGDLTFLANEFLEYTLQEGDLDQIGLWRVRATAIVSGVLVKGDFVKFAVMP